MCRFARPAFAAFVLVVPTALVVGTVVSAAVDRWWTAAVSAIFAVYAAALIPLERSLWRGSRGQQAHYRRLREVTSGNVPLGVTRLLRRHGDPFFYIVRRHAGTFGTWWVLIQRFDDRDMPDLNQLRRDRGRGALVCTGYHLHAWYPIVTRHIDGTTVTPDGQLLPVEPATQLPDARRRPRRLVLRTGLERAEVDELCEIIDALARADIVSGGPHPGSPR